MQPNVAIIVENESDILAIKALIDELDDLAIPYTMNMFSSHQNPAELLNFVHNTFNNNDEYKVLVTGPSTDSTCSKNISAETVKPVFSVSEGTEENTALAIAKIIALNDRILSNAISEISFDFALTCI